MQDTPHAHTRTDTLCSHEKESRVAQQCAAKSKDAASTKTTREWWQVLTSGLLGGCAYPVLSLDVVNGLILRYLLSDLSEQALVRKDFTHTSYAVCRDLLEAS